MYSLSAVILALAVVSVLTGAVAVSAEKPAERHAKRFVVPGPDGRLVYEQDAQGNRIPDFSYAGYRGGKHALPDVPTVLAVWPGEGDDGPRIQAALDAVGAMPMQATGFRGALELEAGVYEIAGSLHLRQSGVVLRGHGDVVLKASGVSRRTLIQLQGEGARNRKESVRIVDDYVPVNARAVNLERTDGLSVGMMVEVRRPSPEEWIKQVGMWQLPGNPGPSWLSWKAGTVDVVWERQVVRIDGNAITLDAPLTCALDAEIGGGTVTVYEWASRLRRCGVENLRCVSEVDAANPHDEEHAWMGVQLDSAEDCWVRGVTAECFVSSAVYVSHQCRRVTVSGCLSRSPVSEMAGQRRHSFYTAGGQTLFEKCRAEDGRHDFATGWMAPGPNVFLDCEALNARDFSGPIESWASGVLYDNVMMDGGGLRLDNRETWDQGAGWCAANSVIWQCQAPEIVARMPPGAQNWVIGAWGQYAGDAHWRGLNEFVEPKSLYRKQLEERVEGGSDRLEGLEERRPVEPEHAPTRHPVIIRNGFVTVDGTVLCGSQLGLSWWRGHPSPQRAGEFGASITRWLPGVSPLNDDLRTMAAQMRANGQAAVRHHHGLWYDRRRDDHQMIRRASEEVWAPFYEQPWARSGMGRSWNGLSKVDLSKFNPWYFGRLREFAARAAENGVVLINAMYFQHNILEAGAHWVDYPWRPSNCLQDTGFPEPPPFVNGKRIFMAEAFYDLTHPVRRDLHRLYIRQCLENLAGETNVVHLLGEEYTGPLEFMQFWLDTAAEWRRETGQRALLALSAPKDVQDAILADPVRAAEVDVIDFKYWWVSPRGTFAPSGGENLAPRQSERQWKGGKPTDATLAAMVAEYRARFPDKAIIGDFPQARWGYLCAGGSLANVPNTADRQLLEAAAKMKPHVVPAGHALRGEGPQYLLWLPPGGKAEIDLSNEVGLLEVSTVDQQSGELRWHREGIAGGGIALLPKLDENIGAVYWLRRIKS